MHLECVIPGFASAEHRPEITAVEFLRDGYDDVRRQTEGGVLRRVLSGLRASVQRVINGRLVMSKLCAEVACVSCFLDLAYGVLFTPERNAETRKHLITG